MDKPKLRATSNPGRQAGIILIGSILVTAAMFLIPSPQNTWWLLAPFRWLHIYVHEFGHGISAILCGGKFDSFEMYTYSGLAHTSTSGSLSQAFVCAGGLCGPAVVGGVFLAMGRNVKWARIALGAFGAFMALSLLIWTRSAFGWGFGACVAAASLFVAVKAKPALAQTMLVFLGVQLALSVYTGGGYLFTQYVTIQNYKGPIPSDTEIMSMSLGLPYWFWGICCGAFSIAILLGGLWLYIRPGKKPKPTAI
jgi:hypothetical protein